MTTPYLLDTSAFRALASDTLGRLAAERPLLASPFCFWEIASHLDEPDQFPRVKGNLMKFCHVCILDDPEAIALAELRATPLCRPRVPDNELIYAALGALRESDSLSSFYAKRIRDSQGNVRTLAGFAARGKDVLRELEEHFLGFMRQIVELVRSGTSTLRTPWDCFCATVSLTNGWHIRECGQPLNLNEDVQVLRILYVYFACVVFCARDYLTSSRVNLDLNDYEDTRLCQHVRLDLPCTIVTDDRNLRSRLKEVFALLETVAVPQLEHAHQVLATKDLS